MSDDVRLGEVISRGRDGKVVFVGMPNDEGVRRNGGRLGASGGPAAFRRLMRRVGTIVNPELGIDLSTVPVSDAGDAFVGGSLEESHEDLRSIVRDIISKGGIPFVVGGGNDQSYPNACGLLDNGLKGVGVINLDAHLDVRPLKEGKVHSGSPFHLLLEDSRFDGSRFVEFAAQGSQCSAVHANYVKSKGGRIMWLSEIQKKGAVAAFNEILTNPSWENIFVSFDLDCVQGSDAPGVSCPAVVGLSAQDALDICFEAGKCPKVACFDLSEYNPAIEDYRTGRLITHMFASFVAGVAARQTK